MTFYCTDCKVRTAGIVLDVRSSCRFCPVCKKPLFQYPNCNREKLERGGDLCETCKALETVRNTAPGIDERISSRIGNGGWTV